MLPVKVRMAPALATMGGKRYAISGSERLEVPENTTMADLPRYMVVDRDATDETPPDRWKVEGSNGNQYTVTKLASGLHCSCPGFVFRKKCKHSKKIADELYSRDSVPIVKASQDKERT
jgi:hypothetical protein